MAMNVLIFLSLARRTRRALKKHELMNGLERYKATKKKTIIRRARLLVQMYIANIHTNTRRTVYAKTAQKINNKNQVQ